MEDPSEIVYTDHPLPSLGLIALLGSFLLGFLALIPVILQTDLFKGYKAVAIGLLILFNTVIIFALHLLHNTDYTLRQEGLQIRYGNQISNYPWSDFRAISWKKGFFVLKIGWLHMTPCVRLRNALVLRRTKCPFPLFITPTDPQLLLEKIHQIHPPLQ